jgi:hypothetical protein
MHLKMTIAVLTTAAAWATVVDRIAVTVGKDVITETEVLEEIRVAALINGDPLDFSPEARRRAAERLVDQRLIRREMEIGQYPEPSAAEVEAWLREIRQQRFKNSAAYQAALERYGVTVEVLKTHVRQQMAALRFTDLRFRAQGLPPPTGAEPASSGGIERAAPASSPTSQLPKSASSADRAARPATTDEQMDSWLREARSRTRVVFMKEAFE